MPSYQCMAQWRIDPSGTERRLAAALGAFSGFFKRENDFFRLLGTSRRFALEAREDRRIPPSIQPRHMGFKRRRWRPAHLSHNSVNRSSSLERSKEFLHRSIARPERLPGLDCRSNRTSRSLGYRYSSDEE
jgi:hypothetical protein